jgi:hypothetical protein
MLLTAKITIVFPSAFAQLVTAIIKLFPIFPESVREAHLESVGLFDGLLNTLTQGGLLDNDCIIGWRTGYYALPI